MGWQTIRITFYKIKKIGRRRGLIWYRFWRCGWKHEIVVVSVFKEIYQRTNVGVAIYDLSLYPGVSGFPLRI